ncbi:MAG: winged helix-turn-helix domain-containing protein [Pseudomonadota bacterium]
MQYRFKNCVLDSAQFTLFRNGERSEVEPQVLRLLNHLISHRDRVVPRQEIFDRVFAGRIVTDNALSVRIRAVRNAVGDTAKEQSVIATITGGGYRFIAPVEVVSHSAARADASADGEPGTTPSSDNTLNAAPAVAVLPFELIGGSADDAVIARGLAHDVTTRIARSRAMYVIARGTSFQFESGSQDVRKVGASLGVRYVAQGAVQIAGRRIRISISLANTQSAVEVGSWQYDREIGDVLFIQDEIAELIVGGIEDVVQREEIRRSTLIPSTNLDAWSAYHRGLGHMYRFRSQDADKAESLFRKAIDLEGKLPRPFAGLSFVHYERAFLNLDHNRKRSLRRALDYASEAIAIDPADPMGYWAMSRALFLSGKIADAFDSVNQATQLNPSYATAQYFSGWLAMQLGKHQDGLMRIDLSRRLSPHDPLIYGMLGVSALALALLGSADEARDRTVRALKHPDVHYQARAMSAVTFSLTGETELARHALQRVRAVKPDYDLNEFFAVYAFQQEDDIKRISDAFRKVELQLTRR